MPDWITHIAVAYSLAVIVNANRRELVVLGALLPDLFKLFLPLGVIIGFGDNFFLGNYFAPVHTFLGAVSHLTMDSLLYPFGYKNWVFWPLLKFDAMGFI